MSGSRRAARPPSVHPEPKRTGRAQDVGEQPAAMDGCSGAAQIGED